MQFLKIIFACFFILFISILIIKRFVYFHPNFKFTIPKENFEDIREGNLHAWYKKGITGKIILFCHGNGGNISYRQNKLIELLQMGYSILIFDYSGFGQSRGVPTEQMCYSNADTFVNYIIRKGYKIKDIIPYGENIGSAVASYIARKYNLKMVIIESGLSSIKNLIKYWNKFLYVFGFIFDDFNTFNFLKGYSGKILVLHCINDEVIPYSTMDCIKKIATKFIDMDGSHNNPNIPWNEIKNFIDING